MCDCFGPRCSALWKRKGRRLRTSNFTPKSPRKQAVGEVKLEALRAVSFQVGRKEG
jgi:hypothetical protein